MTDNIIATEKNQITDNIIATGITFTSFLRYKADLINCIIMIIEDFSKNYNDFDENEIKKIYLSPSTHAQVEKWKIDSFIQRS